MEKFGYTPSSENENLQKLAEEADGPSPKCPKCGKTTTGHPPVCPTHGSKPFEESQES